MKLLLFVLIVHVYAATGALAKEETGQVVKEKGSKSVKSLLGTWYSTTGSAMFSADGTLLSNEQKYKYTANDKVILLIRANGPITNPYQVSSNKLTVNVNGEVTVYSRKLVPVGNNISSSGNSAGGISNELLLSSAWCPSSYNAKLVIRAQRECS